MSKKIKTIGSCQDCLYWMGQGFQGLGDCVRRAPIPKNEEDGPGAQWPVTDARSCCGEFADREKN